MNTSTKILTIFTAFCLTGSGSRLTDDGLTVHEWGTFTSVAGADGGPVDWRSLGCTNELPHFVNDSGFRNLKVSFDGTVRMETPVLYFYSSHDLTANVKVSFPDGLLTEWYPKADHRVLQTHADGKSSALPANLNGIYTGFTRQTGVIEWNAVKVHPGASESAFPMESEPNRYYAARATDAAPLSVGDEHEKFLFYRGVAKIPVALSARVDDDGRILVRNTAGQPVPDVMLFENRGGSIGYRRVDRESGAALARPALDASLSQVKSDLQRALLDRGLYPKEAAAMIDTWRDSWFEEGSRLIYILPESAVNSMLPLEIDPAPAHVSRVFVGRIELITPETKRAVREALATGDRHTLALYRRFLEPIAKSIGKTVNNPCQ